MSLFLPSIRRLRRPRQTGPCRAVFLVGNGRSGTSMLVQHLRRSDSIRLYNEDHAAAFDNYRLREPAIIHALLAQTDVPIALFKPIKDTYLTPQFLTEYKPAQAIFIYRGYADVVASALKRFYHQRADQIGVSVDSIRPPVGVWMADDFAAFASAPPPDVSKARIRALWTPELNRESKIALHWLFQNWLYFDLDLLADISIHLLCYEALVSRPNPELTRLCRFLNIDPDQRMAKGIHSKSVARQPARQLNSQVETACHELMQKLDKVLNSRLSAAERRL